MAEPLNPVIVHRTSFIDHPGNITNPPPLPRSSTMSRFRASLPFLLAGLLAGLALSLWPMNGPRVGLRAAEPQKAEARAKGPDRPTLKTYNGSFDGVIGRTVEESKASWPAPLRAKPGSPNVVYIVIDDVGF